MEGVLRQATAKDLSSLIRLKVREAEDGNLQLVKLSALLWASCIFLSRKGGVSQSLSGWTPKPVRSLSESDDLLIMLGDQIDSTRAYKTFSNILAFLDAEIDPNDFNENQVREVNLEDLQDPILLRGVVQVWLREPSLLRELRQKRRALHKEDADSGEGIKVDSVRYEMKYDSLPDIHLQNLTFLLHALDRPNLTVRPSQFDYDFNAWQPLRYRSAVLAGKGAFKVALCPLPGPWKPQFKVDVGDEQPTFTALPKILEEQSGAFYGQLDRILEQSQRDGIHVLIFPELSIDECAREFLRERLASLNPNPLVAVFAGSYHVGAPIPCNEATVWNGRGRLLWTQEKEGRYRLDPWQLALPATRAFFPGLVEYPAEPVWEGIQKGTQLAIVETQLGRLALLICADALEPEHAYLELVGRVRPDLVIVVAMSPKTGSFERTRERLVDQGIGMLLVNAACVCYPGRKHTGEMVLVDMSMHESGDFPPTRWRWRVGCRPEWYRYQSDSGRSLKEGQGRAVTEPQAELGGAAERWQEVNHIRATGGEESVVWLLEDEVGLVINLGAYLRAPSSQSS